MITPPSAARIPVPPARRWLAFRVRFLPFVVFFVTAAGAAALWRTHVAAPTIVAEAEFIRADVRAPQPGVLANLEVVPMQAVRAGQRIGTIRVADPAVVSASLGVLRATIESLRLGMDPIVDARRALLESSRLQLEWMQARVDLADLRAQLQLAEDEVRRTTQLHASGVLSDEVFQSAHTQRDGLIARAPAQEAMVAQLAPEMDALARAPELSSAREAEATMAAALRVEEEKLRLAELQLAPLPLHAPMDGSIALIVRQPGEALIAGDPVVTIAATLPARVIGYMRQPLAAAPEPGTLVEVRTRRARRSSARAPILEIASSLEPISPTLTTALRLPGPELALRIDVAVPPELALRPGEQVDILFSADPTH